MRKSIMIEFSKGSVGQLYTEGSSKIFSQFEPCVLINHEDKMPVKLFGG